MAKRSKKKRAAPSPFAARPQAAASARRNIWIALALAVAAFLVYWPSLKSDFVYDAHKEIIDEGFITSAANIPTVLTLKVLGMNLMLADRPGQMLYLMLVAIFGGREPFTYHLCSNLLHAANVALLFLFLQRLLASEAIATAKSDEWKLQLAAAAVMLLFALHPIAVESVSEVSYSSSLLVAFFTLLALFAAMAFDLRKKRTLLWTGGAGTLCAFAAVTSKESGLAAVLLLGIYWFLYRRDEAKGPWFWFIGAAAAATVAFLAARFSYAPVSPQHLGYLGGSFSQVFLIQPRLWVFMMGKLVWPFHFSADYEPTEQVGPSTLIAVPILIIVILLQGWLAYKSRIGAMGMAIYWTGLVTVSNFVPLFRPVADRFYYLPLMGVALEIFALLLLVPVASRRFWFILVPVLVALVPLTVLTLKREAVFADNFALWTDTLNENPQSTAAQTGMGWEMYKKGQPDEAIKHYMKAMEINSDYAEVRNNYGLALAAKGQFDDAIVQYEQAEKFNPDTPQIPNNLGLAYIEKGRVADAIEQYQKALRVKPDFVEAHNNLGVALAKIGRNDDAIAEYRKVLELAPGQAETHNNLAIVLAQKGQLNDAIAEFAEAVRLKPDYTSAQDNLAKAKALLNQPPAAK